MQEVIELLENNNPLSNFDIIKICKYLNIKLDNVSMTNQFKYNWLNSPFSIVSNLESTDNIGTHWTAFYNEPETNSVFYMDSYGEVCNQKIYNFIIKKGLNLYFNKKQFQALDSILCGWFCIYFLYSMQKTKNKVQAMINFLKVFDYRDFNKNDKIIKQKILDIIRKKIKS